MHKCIDRYRARERSVLPARTPQVQILGLRSMSAELGLRKPSIAVYVQTSVRWDDEKKLGCQFTQAKESSDPCNQNFMEQLELQVICRLADTQTHTSAQTLARTHAPTHTHTRTRTRARAHTHARTHARTQHTLTQTGLVA